MHGNRVLDLIIVMFWPHALSHPCGGLRIITCQPSKCESRFFGCFVPVNELVYCSFSEILSSDS